MSDSEYESEDDEDYIPEEPSSGEELGITDEIGEKKRNYTKKAANRKKRKGGIKLDEDDDVSDHEESENEAEQEDLEAKKEKDELKLKQRVDDLWAAFKKDTAPARPGKLVTSCSAQKSPEKANEKSQVLKASTSVQKESALKKVEITEIFDFAGEVVKVTKSVDASSIKPVTSSDDNKTAVKPKASIPMKRSGGLGSVLGKIGKKPKLSTLEKTKLDWNSFKKEEGIEDELRTSNRDGYLEKQAFLNRVDHKQFEIERDVRQACRKK